jgi:hypothetical protein
MAKEVAATATKAVFQNDVNNMEFSRVADHIVHLGLPRPQAVGPWDVNNLAFSTRFKKPAKG